MGGGCIAPVYRVKLADGAELAAKFGPGLALEARMLRDLAPHAPVPDVVYVDGDMLLMSYIATRGGITSTAERDLAAVVASIHDVAGPRYGLAYDTVIGGLPQSNSESDDWRPFFRD